jgi:DNA-binding transcriptional LysR family regulator
LRRRAQEILELADKAEQEIIQNRETVAGEIGIGCGETRNMECLSRLMATFRNKYPDVVFNIYTANADDVKERLENGTLDFGLLMEPVEISRYNFVRMPLQERWSVLMRRDSPLAEKEMITPADLVGIPLIISKRQSVRNELENWFGEYSRQMQVVAMVNLSYSNRALMVENHVGVALEYEFDFYDDVLCRRPFSPEMCSRSVLVWRKEQVFSSAVTKFIEHARNEITKM